MPGPVFGEICADGAHVALIGGGDAREDDEAAKALRRMTMAFAKSKPPGGLTAPLTWPLVVQLALTFDGNGSHGSWHPGPKLAAWTREEAARRSGAHQTSIPFALPPGLEPRPYQVQGASQIAAAGKFLLLDEPGTGKTVTTILGLRWREHNSQALADSQKSGVFPLVVIVPAWEVADGWAREIARWAPHWPAPVMYAGPDRMRILADDPRILLTTYATARIDAPSAEGPLAKLKAAAVVLDEFHYCTPYDTMVTTDRGYRRICDIAVGDRVLGVDHRTAKLAWTPVRDVLRSPLRPLVNVGGARLTAEHPVWVSDSGSLCYDNTYARRDDNLRVVRAPGTEILECQQAGPQVLRQELFSPVAHVAAGIHGHAADGQETKGRAPERGSGPELAEDARVPGIGPQSVPGYGPFYPGESARYAREPGLAPVAGRERHGAYYPAGEIARAARRALGHGAAGQDRAAEGQRLPAGLQGGHRAPGAEGSDRSSRQRSRPEREPAGSQKARAAGIPGLDGAVDLEQADPRRSLWNLETDTGNYYADGVLVHNCKNPDAKRSLAARRIADRADTFVGLSGTPITRDTGDIFPALAAMDPGAWTSRERFVKRYCDRADTDYGEVIEGLKQLAEPEFRMTMLGAMRRVAKADVLSELPPKVYSVRRVQIPKEWRRAYDTMLAQMLAELPDGGELPVMDTLSQLTRLIQLASSAADVKEVKEADPVTGEEKVRYEVTLKRPSWKAEALVRVMQERPGQQIVCFSPSAQLVKIAGATAEDEGYKVGYVTGTDTRTHRRDYLEAFAAGRLDLMCATTGAGGTGINELAVAGTAVFLGRGWPLEESIQPEDRLHRIGQEHDCVELIDIVAADTADERVRDRLRSKAGQFADFVKDPRIVRDLLGGLE